MLTITLAAALAVISFDVLGSLASRRLGFPYALLLPGSMLVYAVTGFLAASASNVLLGSLAAAIVGLVDSTIGWALSVRIGPGRVAGNPMGSTGIAGTALLTTLFAAALGLIGAALS